MRRGTRAATLAASLLGAGMLVGCGSSGSSGPSAIPEQGSTQLVLGDGRAAYFSGTGTSSSPISSPGSVAVAPDGTLYVVVTTTPPTTPDGLDQNPGVEVLRRTPAGQVTVFAGTGKTPTSGQGDLYTAVPARPTMPMPATSVTLESATLQAGLDGDLYIAEDNFLDRVTPDGTLTQVVNDDPPNVPAPPPPGYHAPYYAPAPAAATWQPPDGGFVVDRTGTVYSVGSGAPILGNRDHGASTVIQRITPDGKVSTFAGTGGAGDSRPGPPRQTPIEGRDLTIAYNGGLLLAGDVSEKGEPGRDVISLDRITASGAVASVTSFHLHPPNSADSSEVTESLLGAGPDGSVYYTMSGLGSRVQRDAFSHPPTTERESVAVSQVLYRRAPDGRTYRVLTLPIAHPLDASGVDEGADPSSVSQDQALRGLNDPGDLLQLAVSGSGSLWISKQVDNAVVRWTPDAASVPRP